MICGKKKQSKIIIISKIITFLPLKTLKQVYHALFQSNIYYGLQIRVHKLKTINLTITQKQSSLNLAKVC